MARIPHDFIDQLLERTDIVALVDARVPLKKSGREFSACCPFHDEKTPSFTVSPVKQFYHCFGCSAHGTAISFLMEYDRLEFRDAVEVLAQQAGLEIPDDTQATRPSGPKPDPLYDALAFADRFYRRALRQSDIAIDYLKRRGVSGEMARQYGLGYAPNAWNELTGKLRDRAAAEKAGLSIEREQGGHFDRFRNRLMFPIRDTRGRTIAFGGRTLGEDKAKYLNSPETPLFHKSDHMYGLFEARQAMRELPRLLVVEGYMDVIALAQHGFPNAVATLGTATTESHLTTLFRHTEEVMFCFDGDAAGVRAARKAMAQSLPVMRGTRRVRFLFVPVGEDPDTLVRSDDGAQRFQQAIDAAKPASAVLLDTLVDGINLNAPDGRAQMIEKARPYVNALPPETFRTELVAEIAKLAQLPVDDLRHLYARPVSSQRTVETASSDRRQTGARGVHVTAVTRALTLLLAEPSLATRVDDVQALHDSRERGLPILAAAIEFFKKNPTVPVSRWLERYREHRAFDRLQQLASATPPGSTSERENEFRQSIRQLSTRGESHMSVRTRYDALIHKMENGALDPQAAQELNQLHRRLQKTRFDQ